MTVRHVAAHRLACHSTGCFCVYSLVLSSRGSSSLRPSPTVAPTVSIQIPAKAGGASRVPVPQPKAKKQAVQMLKRVSAASNDHDANSRVDRHIGMGSKNNGGASRDAPWGWPCLVRTAWAVHSTGASGSFSTLPLISPLFFALSVDYANCGLRNSCLPLILGVPLFTRRQTQHPRQD